jgi:hypothetical protein
MGLFVGMILEPLKQIYYRKTNDDIHTKFDTNNQTIVERLQCEGERRTLNSIFNEFMENIQSGKISMLKNNFKVLHEL